MSLKTFIAGLGENADFVAFNAHWGFAFFVASLAFWLHVTPIWPVIAACAALAAFKEFYFDKHFELTPTQDFAANLLDWSGYMLGLGLWLVIH
jgi:hypothetical protein